MKYTRKDGFGYGVVMFQNHRKLPGIVDEVVW